CVSGGRAGSTGGAGRVASVFNAAGKVALIAGTGRGDTADGIAPGAKTARLRRRGATRLATGLWEGRKLAHGARYVYGVRGGRVSFVAIAGAGQVHKLSTLRAALRAAGLSA
ncbi:MAG TPA: hypothetical protein VMF14_09665, partial [Solirubrobacteraceae bacterium]|nr:hypothetical protein [Solirubrobacteraceae bacterium]